MNKKFSIEKNTTEDAYEEIIPDNKEVNGWIQHRGPMTGSGLKIHFSGVFNKNFAALYHTMLMPTIFTDVDGGYAGFNKQPHSADGLTYYTDMSLWDTHRNLHSLFVLILPERQRDMILSLIKMGELNANIMPKWPALTGDSRSMVGSSADLVIADSYIKGSQQNPDLQRS